CSMNKTSIVTPACFLSLSLSPSLSRLPLFVFFERVNSFRQPTICNFFFVDNCRLTAIYQGTRAHTHTMYALCADQDHYAHAIAHCYPQSTQTFFLLSLDCN